MQSLVSEEAATTTTKKPPKGKSTVPLLELRKYFHRGKKKYEDGKEAGNEQTTFPPFCLLPFTISVASLLCSIPSIWSTPCHQSQG
jgi:hypothetical protein